MRATILEWAWTHRELQNEIVQSLNLEDSDPERVKGTFFEFVRLWMAGASFIDMSQQLTIKMDDLLALHTRVITFTLQSLVDQGINLLTHRLHADGIEIALGVTNFCEHLRFGAPNQIACILASSGLRHRKAYVALGNSIHQQGSVAFAGIVKNQALEGLRQHAEGWQAHLGDLVYINALKDLS